jgi:hypothetical protein
MSPLAYTQLNAAGLNDAKNEELNAEVKVLEKRKKALKKEVKKMRKNIDRLEDENIVLRGLVLDKATRLKYKESPGAAPTDRASADDIADLSDVQRDLSSILMQLRYMDMQSGNQPMLRGGTGGHLEDEEHVYGYAEYKNWDGSGGGGTAQNGSFTDEINLLYEQLAPTYDDYNIEVSRMKEWVHIVSKLKNRVYHLRRELEEYKDMYDSAMVDLKWNISKLAESEEAKANAIVELGFAKKELRDTNKDNKQESTSSPASQSQPPATSFYFYPSRSVVIIPGSPAQSLQFPRGANLHNIREILNCQNKKGTKLDPAASVVRTIMKTRDEMGIQLPESLLDETVLISVPEPSATDNSVQIAAWETVDNEYVEFVPRQKKTAPAARPFVARTTSTDVNTVHFRELAHLIKAFETTKNDSTSTPSVCSCKSCAVKFAPQDRKFAPPTVSIRGSSDEENELDYYDDEVPEPYDEDDYEEDIVHEDDANDPWDGAYRGGGKDDWNDFN